MSLTHLVHHGLGEWKSIGREIVGSGSVCNKEIVQMPDQQFLIVEKDRNILFLIKNPIDQTLKFEDLNKSKNYLL